MKQTLIALFDLYTIYDRMLDGVNANIKIEYDIDEMIAHDNVVKYIHIIDISFGQDSYDFLKSNSFSLNSIKRKIIAYLKDESYLEELLTENISEEEFKRIEYIFEELAPKAVVSNAFNITDLLSSEFPSR